MYLIEGIQLNLQRCNFNLKVIDQFGPRIECDSFLLKESLSLSHQLVLLLQILKI